MKVVKKIAKWIIAVILIPIAYFLVALVLVFIPVNNDENNSEKDRSIYLNSNGVHLNIILAKNQVDSELLAGLKYFKNDIILHLAGVIKIFTSIHQPGAI